MAQQREDEGPAADISRQRRQGERPDKVAPGQASVKHQIKDLDRSHHDMSRIRQGDKPGHENNHHDLGRTGDRKHPDHGGDQPSGNNRISEHLRRAVFHYIFGDADKGLTSWFIKDGHKIEVPVKVTATAIDQVQVELPNRQQVWLPVDSANVQVGANMSLGIRPEHLLPSDIADVTLEGEVQVVEQLGHETQIHIQIPAIRQNLVYRQNDVVLVEEGATFAIGLPPERCHLFREDGTACRRLHKEPGV